MLNGTVVLAGQLIGTAFACGLNLYATVALLGLAGAIGLIEQLPIGMGGLEHPLVILSAGALFVAGFIFDRVPIVGNAWEAVHTLIRPAAAGLLALLALQTLPWYVQVGGVVGAAVTALAAHGTKSGVRLIVIARSTPTRRLAFRLTLVSLLEDLLAVGLVQLTLLYPVTAVGVLGVALLLLLLAGPSLWRAAMLGFFAVSARLRGFFGRRGWRSRDQLPRAVRQAIPVEPLGRSPVRALSAAVTGLPRIGAYRNGWLVFTCDGPRFVYRSFLGARSVEVPGAAAVQLRGGVLTDALDVSAVNARPFTLFLLKDGPPAHVAAAELSAGHA